jgi:hypothetical protein
MKNNDEGLKRSASGFRRAAVAGLAAVLVALLALAPTSSQTIPTGPVTIFELELPEISLAPTSQGEVVIPSPALTTVVLHVLRPQADQIDYGQIGTQINGRPTSIVAQVVAGPRGKQVRIDLKRYPDYNLVPGRNTVEILARNRRGREFYASFVLKTATENLNDFSYQVALAPGAKSKVPPELALLEPEGEIVLAPSARNRRVRVVGVATAASDVARVTVGGQPAQLKRGDQVRTRGLKLTHRESRVGFEHSFDVPAGATQIVVEAADAEGNKTQIIIPVRVEARPRAEVFEGRKFALIIGISKFRHPEGGITDLRYADADARALSQFLQSPAGGRFPADNILLLLNEQATIARLREAMTSFVSRPGSEDLLVVFFASHGSPDPFAPQNLYFIAHDTQVDRMPETAFAMKEFQRMIEMNVRARRMVQLVDTCHSAGLTGSRGEQTRSVGNNLISLYAERLLYGEEGKAVITASDVNEYSQESPRWGGGHGVFTHFVLDGLRGRADQNADRLVSVGELFRYVRQRVRQDTDFAQNPRMLVGTNENISLAAVSVASN